MEKWRKKELGGEDESDCIGCCRLEFEKRKRKKKRGGFLETKVYEYVVMKILC